MRLIAIMQPTYIPWMGYFDLMDSVDQFVFLDDVRVVKQSWGVRNRVKTPQGERFLSVPILKNQPFAERTFVNTRIDYSKNWVSKHIKTITQAYSKAPYFTSVFSDFEAMLSRSFETIGALNINIIMYFTRKMGIETSAVCASELDCAQGKKDERLVAICKMLGADGYIATPGSAVYIEADTPGGEFSASNIELFYHNYEHPVYSQVGGQFLSHMAIIDVLMNRGYTGALETIRSGRRSMIGYMEFRKRTRRSSEPQCGISKRG